MSTDTQQMTSDPFDIVHELNLEKVKAEKLFSDYDLILVKMKVKCCSYSVVIVRLLCSYSVVIVRLLYIYIRAIVMLLCSYYITLIRLLCSYNIVIKGY